MHNYSNSKCPTCQNNLFELAEDAPAGSKFKIQFIRCSSCKTVVGTMDYLHTPTLIKDLAKKLGVTL